MREKIGAYLEGLFSQVPDTQEVRDAKAELYDSMLERYDDCVADGMDEQEAYDNVIDSVGDIRELFDELSAVTAEDYSPWADAQPEAEQAEDAAEGEADDSQAKQAGQSFGFDLNSIVKSITDFTSGLVNGLFGPHEYTGDMELVNTQALPLDGISSIDVSYISESITVLQSHDDQFVVKEYMNRSDDPSLLCEVSMRGGSLTVRNGRRQGIFGLRARIEIYVPATFTGGLSVSTVSGHVTSNDEWYLASLTAKTVSGHVEFRSVSASMIRLSSTSGHVQLGRGVGSMDLHSISGSVKVENAEGGGSFKTTSGGVRVNFEKLTGHIDTSSISGGVRLGLPADASFEFDGRTVSGHIHTGFDGCLTFQKRNKAHGFVGQAPYYHVRASSTSGSIHVND